MPATSVAVSSAWCCLITAEGPANPGVTAMTVLHRFESRAQFSGLRDLCRTLAAAALLGALVVGDFASAQGIQFPPASQTGLAAEIDFHVRKRAVIRFNACAREFDYANLLRAQRLGEHGGDGENLGALLIAKIGWLKDGFTQTIPCTFTRTYERAPDQATEAFKEQVLAGWNEYHGCTVGNIEQTDSWVQVEFRVTPECMRGQINEAIRGMRKTAVMGTPIPCLDFFGFPPLALHSGDFDVNVRELVRILYMSRDTQPAILAPETIEHMWKELLAARGPLGLDVYSMAADCDLPAGDELGTPEEYADRHEWDYEVLETLSNPFDWLLDFLRRLIAGGLGSAGAIGAYPYFLISGEDAASMPMYDLKMRETENHRLMIETSRYLINQAIIRDLVWIQHSEVEDVREYQAPIREWLLKTLQNIFAEDFAEYNARPYTRYSLEALVNLHEFADDPALRDASRMVLDLSAAKFAATSNRGRRVVPFRRLSDADGFGEHKENQFLYNGVRGADHEVVRALLFAGQVQFIGGVIDANAAGPMVNTAVSRYYPPRPIMSIAIDRPSPSAYREKGAHEQVYSTPAFTTSMGGRKTEAALKAYELQNDVDRGVAMPTVIIPTGAPDGHGSQFRDLFYFDGEGIGHERSDNTCLYKNFICGYALYMSQAFLGCTIERSVAGEPAYFVNSAACPTMPGPHFYVVGHRNVLEIVGAPDARAGIDPGFDAFIAGRIAAFTEPAPAGLVVGTQTYRMTTGERVHFEVTGKVARLIGVDRPVNDATNSFEDPTDQIITLQRTPFLRATIACPWRQERLVYDFTNWDQPQIGVP